MGVMFSWARGELAWRRLQQPGGSAPPPLRIRGSESCCCALLGAALQILATWAVVHALTPEEAGVYFRGFVIALGLSTLLRGKYEIYLAQHIIGRRAATTGIRDGVLLMQLARRMLLRSSLLCAVLLVVTADLDIQAPQLQTILQTYLPFVLAVPCVSLSSLLGEALRAANRTLGIVVAAYAVNLSMLLAVVIAPSDASLALYSWAFLLGSLVSAGVAAALAWRAFPIERGEGRLPIRREALQGVDSRELIGLARGLLLWGPLCVLAVWAPPIQMAQYAVAARTALIVDIFLPALNLTGCRETLTATQPVQARAAPAAQATGCSVGLQLSVRGAALGIGAGNPGALREAIRFAAHRVCAASGGAMGKWCRSSRRAAGGSGVECAADRRRCRIRRRGGRADLRAGRDRLRCPGRRSRLTDRRLDRQRTGDQHGAVSRRSIWPVLRLYELR